MSEEKSRLRKDVEQIPNHKRKLHRSLTRISMRVNGALRKQDMTLEDLEKKIGRYNEDCPGEWMMRMLGGGVNLSLRTIFKLEEALDIKLVDVFEHESEEMQERRRND